MTFVSMVALGAAELIAIVLFGEAVDENIATLSFLLCMSVVILGVYLYRVYRYESLKTWLRNIKLALANIVSPWS